MAHNAANVLAVIGGEHRGLHPVFNGIAALVALLVLLFLVTRLNRDR